ncbi:hypothetical protein AQ619_04635 [Caulobacter henricii]|uniref:Uncharacterized protein n=1 Tax=Caulobacter henricii TaxID=69395 RepID=A0A0N7JH86_9CAUL|nr:hypothetical protein AQ619_04635 [Caulobacter henricii]
MPGFAGAELSVRELEMRDVLHGAVEDGDRAVSLALASAPERQQPRGSIRTVHGELMLKSVAMLMGPLQG